MVPANDCFGPLILMSNVSNDKAIKRPIVEDLSRRCLMALAVQDGAVECVSSQQIEE